MLDIWDTAGQERFRYLVYPFVKNSDCVIIGYDITRQESFDNKDKYWYPITKDNSDTDLIFLIANKNALYDDEVVREEDDRKYAKNNKMRYFSISCRNSTRIKEFLDDMTDEFIKI